MSSDGKVNSTPTGEWLQRQYSNPNNGMIRSPCWFAGAADARTQVSPVAPLSADAQLTMNGLCEELDGITSADLKMKKGIFDEEARRNVYKHVPHKDRPPLIVARRNARERRRVQAVNSAFMRLRKIVPIISNRGKRVSKVKTLKTAIDYISGLQALLKDTHIYYDIDIISDYQYQSDEFCQDLEDFEHEF